MALDLTGSRSNYVQAASAPSLTLTNQFSFEAWIRPRTAQCGTILSRAQYLVDVERWGYADPRLAPQGNLTEHEAAIWTAGIADDGPADALEAA